MLLITVLKGEMTEVLQEDKFLCNVVNWNFDPFGFFEKKVQFLFFVWG